MWYPEWFSNYEQFLLSAVATILFGCSLCLIRIQETLRGIKKDLQELTERKRNEIGEGVEKYES